MRSLDVTVKVKAWMFRMLRLLHVLPIWDLEEIGIKLQVRREADALRRAFFAPKPQVKTCGFNAETASPVSRPVPGENLRFASSNSRKGAME